MTDTQLKFPSGDFTHSELAQLNGQTNQQVWVRYQAAIKAGIIVSAGERRGKGKPSKLWRLATGQPVPLPTPTVKVVIPEKVVTVQVNKTEIVSVPETSVPKVELPQNQPVATVAMLTADVPVEEPATVEMMIPSKKVMVEDDTHEIGLKCPICQHKLWAKSTETGTVVWCCQTIQVCKATENPFGHGKNELAAYGSLCEKFRHI